MVFICDTSYNSLFNTSNINETLQTYFNSYPFELDNFQKFSLHGIFENKHVLITAHTGSGKTMPAEFCIDYFTQHKQKKVIYTSPIKSLSNQKFYEFTQKFPHIEFGILTGDIKYNPDAQVIIMTTEILRNTLLKPNTIQTENTQFDIDIHNEVGCIIFDEIHYINDEYRGHVWEETILLMPKHIQMLMLSATIHQSEQFSQWIETTTQREVWLCPNTKRVIPLTHYSFMASNQYMYKKNKSKDFETILDEYCDSLIPIKTSKNSIQLNHLEQYKKIQEFNRQNSIYIRPIHSIEKCVSQLKQNKMLPAICFVFSRNKVESYAKSISIDLIDDTYNDNNVFQGYVKKECEMIIRNKIPNHQEFMLTDEYIQIIQLLQKGIAIHHSGMIPIFKEMIELLFSKGYIQLLFATETFSVGINMPAKTTIFTNLNKFDGSKQRILLPHEYTQMAGRAGRRGLDDVGHVVHLNSLFDIPDIHTYTHILNGNPQSIQSKLYITPELILQMLYMNEKDTSNNSIMECDILNIVKHSYSMKDISSTIKTIQHSIEKNTLDISNIQYEIDSFRQHNINSKELDTYIELQKSIQTHNSQKQKKKNMINLKQIETQYPVIKQIYSSIQKLQHIEKNSSYLKSQISYYTNYYENEIIKNMEFLKQNEFLFDNTLTIKGKIASCMKEINSIVVSNFFDILDSLNHKELLFCITFLNTSFSDKNDTQLTQLSNYTIQNNKVLSNSSSSFIAILQTILKQSITIQDFFTRQNIFFQSDDFFFSIHMFEIMNDWYDADQETQCKTILHSLQEYNIFTGEFIKFVLKNVAIIEELKHISQCFSYTKLLHNLSYIQPKIMKSIVSNQSIYV